MTARALHVVATGALTLVEDLGRTGLAAVGVGRSGAADRGAYLLGNRLVGHLDHLASLEVLLGGLVVRAQGRVTVALTGAVAPATVNGRRVPHASVVEVPDGGELRLGRPARGVRTYVAVRGGVDVEPVLGSRSTDTLSGVGPAAVVAGQRLPVGPSPATFPTVDHAAGHPAHEAPAALSVLPGPRSAWIGGVSTLAATAWEVGPHSDRVGLRLTGGRVRRVPRHRDVELPSEGLVRGAVQLPPDGNPVVFLADHPVTGGYPVVGVLTEAAVDRAAQLRPGDGVRFVVASPDLR